MRFFLLLTLFVVGCAHRPLRPGGGAGSSEQGLASYYASSMRGHRTASGESYNPRLFTAAHRTLPFGSRVEVRNLANGRVVAVRVNDRGPFVEDRIIDLSYAAAKALGLVGAGVAEVEIRMVDEH